MAKKPSEYWVDDGDPLVTLALKAVQLAEEKGNFHGKLEEKDETIRTLQRTLKEQGELIERLANAHGGNGCTQSNG